MTSNVAKVEEMKAIKPGLRNGSSKDVELPKIGQLARTRLRAALENFNFTETEIEELKSKESTKQTFGLNLPLLVDGDDDFEKVRYYADPVTINGKDYWLCSQWFESSRQKLIDWLDKYESRAEAAPSESFTIRVNADPVVKMTPDGFTIELSFQLSAGLGE